MEGEKSIAGLLEKAWEDLKSCDARAAQAVLEEALRIDFAHPDVVYALKCVNWWLERLRKLEEFQDAYDRGGYILAQWKQFHAFLDRLGGPREPCHYAVRRFVFSSALIWFQDLLGDGVNRHDPGLLLHVGQCYKGVGNYDQALKYLNQARDFRREDGETLSELADVNALLENSRDAKVYFREAFFWDPQGVDLRSMESEMILRLRDRVREEGKTGAELLEWMPIFGSRVFGVFTVKRTLRPVEVGRLRQSIFSLENELRGQLDNAVLLEPRLLNRYFWLLDHYEYVKADPGMIEEIMLKIKILNPGIYGRIR